MRILKFRAWDKEKKKMINLQEIGVTISTGSHLCFGCEEWGHSDESKCNDDNFELMQFTGLQDKNGKDIYEGDIIDNFNDGKLFVIEIDEYGIILYGDNNKKYWNRIIPEPLNITQKHIITCLGSQCVIIGNIHENPELLK